VRGAYAAHRLTQRSDRTTMTDLGDAEIVPLELGTFSFPEDELPGLQGVVMGYLVRHRGGLLLFDTGFGFGNAELDERYHPRPIPIGEALRSAGVELAEIQAVVNCHLHADHAGQNWAFPGVPIYVQAVEWQIAHTTDHTILEWIDFEGSRYLELDGDHRVSEDVTIISTPGHTAGHQSLAVRTTEGLVVLAGQACYTTAEWRGESTALEGRSRAPDRDVYDRSIMRLRDLSAVSVRFGHDRTSWTA
jgi:glyoxylase-like metal-dependent hydrolase (beta-lactamase superfamily II)